MEITFEFATQDDCLDKMIPSDLRCVVAERDRAIKERDALAAKVEALQKTVVSVKARGNILHNLTLQLMQAADLNGSDWDYISEAQATEIQHHLIQVRADAGRDGFIAGVNYMIKEYSSPSLVVAAVEQYHASILAGKE